MTIELTNISKAFEREVLKNFTLKIPEGEFLGIKGESGSGKTTLLNIIGAIEEVDSGRVRLDNLDYTQLSAKEQIKLYRKQISFVFQNFGLLENESIRKNLSLVLKIKKVPKKTWEDKIQEVLDQVNLGYLNLEIKPHALSGGEQQRVALARTILSNNPIILADEPTGSLDDQNGDLVMNILKQMNESGKTIVVVTHTDRFDSIFKKIVHLEKNTDGTLTESKDRKSPVAPSGD
ncbi:MAG: ABC transporter ATP-binding protein [Streptococcaceae bacterium]|nr:ABC transporter ATP-binding protein [Streptococcaceae bacterium]